MARPDNSSEDEKPLKKRKLNAWSQARTAAEEQPLQPNRNVEASTTALPSPDLEARRHPTLWFPDGSLTVVASDGVEFKLYPGLLTRHSEILKERIANLSPLGTPELVGDSGIDSHQETTLHLPENGDDLSELFGIIYDGSTQTTYYNLETRITFAQFYRILRLGVKYKMQHIMESGFARLEQAFPSDFDAWIGSKKVFCGSSCPIEVQPEDTVLYILLARDAERVQLLPVMLYVCASEVDSACLLEGVSYASETFKLDVADQVACVDARRDLQEIEAGTAEIFLGMAFNGPAAQCTARQTCNAACEDMFTKGLKEKSFHRARPFSGWDKWIEGLPKNERPCTACRKHLRSEVKQYQKREWEKLGEIFNIPDWSPPKKQIVAAG